MVPPANSGGRKRTIDVREILNEIFYVLRSGCQWQALPKGLPPKSTVWAGVALVPISISGCGLREVAAISPRSRSWTITALRAGKSIALFGVFGLTLAIGSLPEAVTWLLYSFAPSRHSVEPDGRAWSQNEGSASA